MFIDIQICDKEFKNSDLKNEKYDNVVFKNCTFDKVNFDNTSLIDCLFTECLIALPKLNNVTIRDLEFTNCNLMNIDWSDFSYNQVLSRPLKKFNNCNLKYNSFYKMEFRKFDFSHNNFLDCDFEYCNLNGANFRYCDLSKTVFTNNDLSESDFRDSTDFNINIFNNTLKKSKFTLLEATNLLSNLDIDIY